MEIFGKTNKTYLMSAGTLLGEEDDGTYNIRICRANGKETVSNIGLESFLVWETGKTGILDEDEFCYFVKKLFIWHGILKNGPGTDDLLKERIEKTVLDLIKSDLIMIFLGSPEFSPDMVKTQIAMTGLFLPMLKGNERRISEEPSVRLKLRLAAKTLKANFLSDIKKEILAAIDSGGSMFDYCCSIIGEKKEVGDDIDWLICNGYLDCYGWYLNRCY